MREKRIKFSFGRYRQVTVTELATVRFEKLPKKAATWVEALIDEQLAVSRLSQARLRAAKEKFSRQILESEPITLTRNRNRLHEVEIQIRTRIHKEAQQVSSRRAKLTAHRSHLMLSLDRASGETTAFRRRINAVQNRNTSALNSALSELRAKISTAFNPTIDWHVFVELFPRSFPTSSRNDDLELASWVHSDPKNLTAAIEDINTDLGRLSKSSDEGDILLHLVNFAREARGGSKVKKDDWFDYRAGMFSRDRAMPAWVTSAAKMLGVEYQANFYLGTELVAAGHNTLAFGLVFELIPGTKFVSSKQNIYQEPANGWSFGNRRYNLGGDR